MKIMITSSLKSASPSGISGYWLQRERLQPARSLPKSTRYGLRQQNHGPYLISDIYETNTGMSWWTDDPKKCQVYYDLDHAIDCADRLASITAEQIEVVILDA